MNKCCGTCRFYQPKTPAAEPAQGECQRLPPTAVLMVVSVRSVANPNGEQRTTPAAIRPPVLEEWWCGEWQERGPDLVN